MKDKHLGTMLVFVTVLVIIYLFTGNRYLLYAAVGTACIGLFIPWLSRKIHTVWMKFAEMLGFVMNRVLLSVVFFIFLVPVAFLSRLFRKPPMGAHRGQLSSYYTERNFTYTRKSLEDLW